MRTSDILHRLQSQNTEVVSVSEIVAALGDRTFALLIVFLGLPNCIPMPPPIPLISAFMLMIIAVQMARRAPTPWLPARVARATLAQKDVARVAARALPAVLVMERWSSARLQWFPPAMAALVMGALLFFLGLCILFAAPIIGQIPFGLAVCCIGLGLVERDGVIVLIGTVIAAIGLFISAGFAYALLTAFAKLF